MFDEIVGWVVAAGAGALAIWGVRWKMRAELAKRQIEEYRASSDKWQKDAAKRVEEIRKQAATEFPVDPKKRNDFESSNGA